MHASQAPPVTHQVRDGTHSSAAKQHALYHAGQFQSKMKSTGQTYISWEIHRADAHLLFKAVCITGKSSEARPKEGTLVQARRLECPNRTSEEQRKFLGVISDEEVDPCIPAAEVRWYSGHQHHYSLRSVCKKVASAGPRTQVPQIQNDKRRRAVLSRQRRVF